MTPKEIFITYRRWMLDQRLARMEAPNLIQELQEINRTHGDGHAWDDIPVLIKAICERADQPTVTKVVGLLRQEYRLQGAEIAAGDLDFAVDGMYDLKKLTGGDDNG